MLLMKKVACIVASTFGAVALFALPGHTAGLLTNNPDFNAAPYDFGTIAGWTNTSGAGYFGASDAAIEGKEGAGLGYLGQGAVLETVAGSRASVTTPGSELFALTFQAQNDGATNPGTASIVFYNASGTELFAATSIFTADGNLANTYSLTGLAPANAATVAARVSTTNTPAPVSQFRVDNFVLTSTVTVVPEANSLILVTGALGALAMVIRRRKA